MSSYLVGFVVSDFISLESRYQGKVPHRVFARSNAISNCHFILDNGVKLLDALGDYLGVDYPLPKMDQVAIPDFYFNAMENWGTQQWLMNGKKIDSIEMFNTLRINDL